MTEKGPTTLLTGVIGNRSFGQASPEPRLWKTAPPSVLWFGRRGQRTQALGSTSSGYLFRSQCWLTGRSRASHLCSQLCHLKDAKATSTWRQEGLSKTSHRNAISTELDTQKGTERDDSDPWCYVHSLTVSRGLFKRTQQVSCPGAERSPGWETSVGCVRSWDNRQSLRLACQRRHSPSVFCLLYIYLDLLK